MGRNRGEDRWDGVEGWERKKEKGN